MTLAQTLALEWKEWPSDSVSFIVDGDQSCTRAEWQAAVDALNAPKVVEWDGVGLPPVGEKVEVILKASTLPASLQGWNSGDIVECVAHVYVNGMLSPLFLKRAPNLFSTLRDDCYRPIRTAAKVAAEEREKAVNLMLDVTNIRAGIISDRRAMARQLYDAGYRKEPKPCGS